MKNEQKDTRSRRRFLRSTGLIATGLAFTPSRIFAQESPVIALRREAVNAPLKLQPVRGNIHLLTGSGGNIAVFNGPGGRLLVDAGIETSQKKMADLLSTMSNDPLKYLVNTHWHFDHAGGNEWLHSSGATIVAHDNTRKNLAGTVRVEDWNYTFSPSPKGALPETVFSTQHTLHFNGEAIQMHHYPAAHTNGDISVYFPEKDVLHTGDLWWNGHYPFFDHSSGGAIDGMIAASDALLKISNDKTIIIPGHGELGNRRQLSEFRHMLAKARENVSKLKKEGRSLQDTISAKPTAEFDPVYGNFLVSSAAFIKLVYVDV